MIASFEHDFVFVKVPKTAGTSVELVLEPLAGERAIVTPITPPEPGHRARHAANSLPVVARALWRARSTPGGVGRAWRDARHGEPLFFNHMPASLVRERIGRRVWDRSFTFCFERNPWDKAVSLYFWRTRRLGRPPGFDEWATTPGNLASDWDLYAIDGDVAVTFVGRYEALSPDLATALARVGISSGSELPRAKASLRPVGTSTAIGELADSTIRRVYAREIRHFGYERPADVPWN